MALADGSCLRPGVPPDGCSPGFAHDGDYGCTPVLPAGDCPAGRMALPGETACRPVMPCAAGKWGAIPVDAATVYVDAATGNDALGKGAAASPYKTIGKGYAAAAPGAIVAVAAGSYAEDVVVNGKPARIWGVCPDQVEIVGTGKQILALQITLPAASGSEVHGLALRGPKQGVGVAGAKNVVLDRLWVHDTGFIGIPVVGYFGPSAVHITGTLVEHSQARGIDVQGGEIDIDGTVVRDVAQTSAKDPAGGGIAIQNCGKPNCNPPAPATAAIRRTLVERTQGIGLLVFAATVTLEDSVLRHGLTALDGTFGAGITAQSDCGELVCTAATPGALTVRGSVVDDQLSAGVFARGADVTLERTVVRATKPRSSDGLYGRGLESDAQLFCDAPTSAKCSVGVRPKLTARASLVDANHNIGVYGYGADLDLDGVVVRHTLPRPKDQRYGVGIEIVAVCSDDGACAFASPGHARIAGSLVDDSQWNGMLVSSSAVEVSRSLVRATRAGADQAYGDGIDVSSDFAPATLTLDAVLVADSARAGVGAFGTHVALKASTVRCAGFPLEGESFHGAAFAFIDQGGNRCGCGDAFGACKAVSTNLLPPSLGDP